MEQKQNKRRFSLEDDFMKTRTDTHLYGFMRCLSTAMPDGEGKWKEYLLVSTFNKSKKVVMGVCGIGTQKTLKRHIDDLIAANLIEVGSIKVKGKDYACYFFPFDYDGNFKLLDKELVRYMVDTGNAMTIRTYLYLLNCSTAKKDWEFSCKEIVEALGYDREYQPMQKTVGNILDALKKCGLINYIDTYKTHIDDATGREVPEPVKILKSVSLEKPVG